MEPGEVFCKDSVEDVAVVVNIVAGCKELELMLIDCLNGGALLKYTWPMVSTVATTFFMPKFSSRFLMFRSFRLVFADMDEETLCEVSGLDGVGDGRRTSCVCGCSEGAFPMPSLAGDDGRLAKAIFEFLGTIADFVGLSAVKVSFISLSCCLAIRPWKWHIFSASRRRCVQSILLGVKVCGRTYSLASFGSFSLSRTCWKGTPNLTLWSRLWLLTISDLMSPYPFFARAAFRDLSCWWTRSVRFAILDVSSDELRAVFLGSVMVLDSS